MRGERVAARIELKDARDHHDGLRVVAIFKQREAKRFDTVDKQPAASSALVLHDPISAAVLADHEH